MAAEVVEEHKQYSVARTVSLLQPSPARRTAPCPYAGACGGCSWQQVSYDAQLHAKQQNVADALARVGGLSGFELLPILPASSEFHYRRRIGLHVDGGRRLGFRRAFSRDLVEVANCLIADPDADRGIGVAAEWVQRLGTRVSRVEILSADQPGQIILSAVTRHPLRGADARACKETVAGPVAGIVMAGPGWRRQWGDTTLSFVVDGDLTLRHDADTFGQVNPDGNQRLVDELLSWGAFGPRDRVLELYAGAGNLTLPMARRVQQVTAVEASRKLVQNGKRNAEDNGLHNIRWRGHDAARAVEELIREGRRFSTLVLNPAPRRGQGGGPETGRPWRPADSLRLVQPGDAGAGPAPTRGPGLYPAARPAGGSLSPDVSRGSVGRTDPCQPRYASEIGRLIRLYKKL